MKPGSSRPDSSKDGRSYVPPPSPARYMGYLADAYEQADAMRTYKKMWFLEREDWVVRNPDNLQGSMEDRKRAWGKTCRAEELASLEQWAQRQVMAYTALAEAELLYLTHGSRMAKQWAGN